MSDTCEIQWVDAKGQPTPDDRPAIGRVYLIARVEQIHGRGVAFPESRHYRICAEHARALGGPGMHYWRFEPANDGSLTRPNVACYE